MHLHTLAIVLATSTAVTAAGVKISDLALSTSPSTNTYLEIADLNASGTNRSAKILYTNLVTRSQFNNLTGTVIASGTPAVGDVLASLDGTVTNGVWTSAPEFKLTPIGSKLLIGNGQASAQWGDVPFSYSPGPVTIDTILTNAQTTTEFSFAGLSVSFSFHSLTNQLPTNYVTDLSGIWSQLMISENDANSYGDLAELQGNVLNYGTGTFIHMNGVLGRADNASSASGTYMAGGDFAVQNDSSGQVVNAYGVNVPFVQSTTATNFQNAYGIATIIPAQALNKSIGVLVGSPPTLLGQAAIYQSGNYTNYLEGVTQFGLPAPDLSNYDGNASTFSSVYSGGANQMNVMGFNNAGTCNLLTVYGARGTKTSPSDLSGGDIIFAINPLGRSAGDFQYGSTLVWLYQTNYIDTVIQNGGQIGVTTGFAGSQVAFAAVSSGHGEINSGKPVSKGGSLAILDVGGLASKASDTAVAISATGWTNTFGKNATVSVLGTNATCVVYNNAGSAVSTNTSVAGHTLTLLLQSGGKFITTAGATIGSATPF